jgi:GMP synthase-like glutamine amidotransferase
VHRDVIHTLPPGTINLASTESCTFQGLYIPDRALSLQGHFEFDEEIQREILVRKKAEGVLSDELVEDALLRVGNRHDGLAVSKAILRFLRPEAKS